MYANSKSFGKYALALVAAALVLCGAATANDGAWGDRVSIDQALKWSAPLADSGDSDVVNQPSLATGSSRLSIAQALRLAAPVNDSGDRLIVEKAQIGAPGQRLSRSQALRLAAPVGDASDISAINMPVIGS